MDSVRVDQLEYSTHLLRKALKEKRGRRGAKRGENGERTIVGTSEFHHEFVQTGHERHLMLRFDSKRRNSDAFALRSFELTI